MFQKESEGIHWLEFELLSECKELVHGCFLRHGGISDPPYKSLNLGQQVGDSPKSVLENRKRIMQALQLQHLVPANQCHGIDIAPISRFNDTSLTACDALTTQGSGIGLMISHADCQACIIYDPIKKALANVHSGWRGSIQNIYAATIRKMQQQYGCNPKNLLAAISPSLGPHSAEFINYKKELPQSFWKFSNAPNYFDFWKISRWQLEESGILPSHIQIAETDTFTNPEDYFSYRYAKICGRNATVCALK